MITTMTAPPLSSDKRNPHIRRITIVQIISGGLSLVLGIIGVIWYSIYDWQVGSGIWAGLFVIATGIVGYQSVKKNAMVNSVVTYTAYLVMNIISSVLTGAAIFCTSATSVVSMYWIGTYCDERHWDPDWVKRCYMFQGNARAAWGASLILAINLSTVFVASIAASALCCVCCGRTSQQQPQNTLMQQQPIMIQQSVNQPQPMAFQQTAMPVFLLQQMPLSAPQQQQLQQQVQLQQPQQDHHQQQELPQPKSNQEHHQEVHQVRDEIQQQLEEIRQINQGISKNTEPDLPEYLP